MSNLIALPIPGGMTPQGAAEFQGALALALSASPGDHIRTDSRFSREAQDAAAAMMGDPSACLDLDRYNYFRERADSLVRAELAKGTGQRLDGMTDQQRADSADSQAFHMAKDLEKRTMRIVEEKIVRPDLFDHFTVDQEYTGPGVEVFSARRFRDTGQAAIWSGSESDVPRVGAAQSEYKVQVKHIVTGWGVHMFDRRASIQAGTRTYERLVRSGRRAVENFIDAAGWQGVADHDLRGVFGYNNIDQMVVPVTLSSAAVATQAGAMEVVRYFTTFAEHAYEKSAGQMMSTKFIMPTRTRSFLADHYIPGTTRTLLEHIESRLDGISMISTSAKCKGAGYNGMDAMFVGRSDEEGVQMCLPQGYTVTPSRTGGTRDDFLGWASFGGMIEHQVGSCTIGHIAAPSN